MSSRKVILTNEEALKRKCRVCHSPPGEKCKTATGQIMENIPHEYRKWTYISDIDRALSDPGNSGP